MQKKRTWERTKLRGRQRHQFSELPSSSSSSSSSLLANRDVSLEKATV
jgi:hypothetical protein